MDMRFLGLFVLLLVVLSGGAAIAVLTLGQIVMVALFLGSVVAEVARRFSSDDEGTDG